MPDSAKPASPAPRRSRPILLSWRSVISPRVASTTVLPWLAGSPPGSSSRWAFSLPPAGLNDDPNSLIWREIRCRLRRHEALDLGNRSGLGPPQGASAMLHDWGVIAAAFGYIGFLF